MRFFIYSQMQFCSKSVNLPKLASLKSLHMPSGYFKRPIFIYLWVTVANGPRDGLGRIFSMLFCDLYLLDQPWSTARICATVFLMAISNDHKHCGGVYYVYTKSISGEKSLMMDFRRTRWSFQAISLLLLDVCVFSHLLRKLIDNVYVFYFFKLTLLSDWISTT